jgi:hypothetical protein
VKLVRVLTVISFVDSANRGLWRTMQGVRMGRVEAEFLVEVILAVKSEKCFWVCGLDDRMNQVITRAFENVGCTVDVDGHKLRITNPATAAG